MYSTKGAAQVSGVSVRTLHYYDTIGLLTPRKAENGYRYYDDKDLDRLQKILFYKYLGFPLQKIAELLEQSADQQVLLMEQQLDRLHQEQASLSQVIATMQATLKEMKGGKTMTVEEKFKGFRFDDHKQYRKEAIEAYGQEAIERSEQSQKGKEAEVAEQFNDVFFSMADSLAQKLPVSDALVQEKIAELHELICTYGFDCNLEAFRGIGAGYANDPRFTKNIDQFGQGTAHYTSQAISYYVDQKSK